MDTGALLLRAILEEPAEDTPRLVYADWLEENGQPERAEFIRIQCKIARMQPTELFCEKTGQFLSAAGGPILFTSRCRCRPCTLCRRHYNVGKRYVVWSWCGKVPSGSVKRYLRGFVHSVRFNTPAFLSLAETVFADQPIEEVELVDKRPWFGRWGHSSGDAPDVFAWWVEAESDHRNEIPPELAEHMVCDQRRIPTPQDYKPRNRVGGCIAFAHESSAVSALSTACVAYGRRLAGLPPLVAVA